MMQTEKLLQNFRLSQTNMRKEILDILDDSSLALSMNEIKLRLKSNYNRVTLYRNLKVLTEKGILHQIHIDRQDSKYVLPVKTDKAGEHDQEHLHFKCLMCNEVKCLTDQHPEQVILPEGYEKIEVNFVVYGICRTCKNNN
jgi:Fur family ferric uptake transcriptional regulator